MRSASLQTWGRAGGQTELSEQKEHEPSEWNGEGDLDHTPDINMEGANQPQRPPFRSRIGESIFGYRCLKHWSQPTGADIVSHSGCVGPLDQEHRGRAMNE